MELVGHMLYFGLPWCSLDAKVGRGIFILHRKLMQYSFVSHLLLSFFLGHGRLNNQNLTISLYCNTNAVVFTLPTHTSDGVETVYFDQIDPQSEIPPASSVSCQGADGTHSVLCWSLLTAYNTAYYTRHPTPSRKKEKTASSNPTSASQELPNCRGRPIATTFVIVFVSNNSPICVRVGLHMTKDCRFSIQTFFCLSFMYR